MHHKIIPELFQSHNEARDKIAKNPEIILQGSILIEKEFKITRGSIDILIQKEEILYFVEIKDRGSICEARRQLDRYGRLVERFNSLSGKRKIKFIVVKIQKYLGTDVYCYDDIEDLRNRNTDYNKIHRSRLSATRNLKKVREKYEIGVKNSKDKWKKNWSKGMGKHHNKDPNRYKEILNNQ